MFTDSQSTFNLSTRIKEPEEKLNKVDLSCVREAFESGYVSIMCWIFGHYMIADALTKNNPNSIAHLVKVLRTGIYPTHPDRIERSASKGQVLIAK